MNASRRIIFLLICMYTVLETKQIFGHTFGKTFFAQRSQGLNAAHKIIGSQYIEQIIDCLPDYNRCTVTLEWLQSFDTKKLGEFLFFNGTPRLRFGDIDDPNVDIFSRNFFLNDDFQGTANIDPIIKNFTTHIDISISRCNKGFYASLHVPIVWTFWNLDLDETKPIEGTEIPAQTFGNTFTKPALVNSIVKAWRGDTINTNSNPNKKDEDFFPDLKQKMHFATIKGPETRAGIGDVELTVGYNIISKPDAHFDVQARLIIPAGTRPQGKVFFEPVVGGGNHWQIGLGITGHDTLECTKNSSLTGFVDGGIYYIVPTRQKRTFDLKNNGIGSRYLLFKRFNSAGEYAHEVLFGPNVTTLDCQVGTGFITDVAGVVRYTWKCLDLSLGYNFWGRGQEKIKLKGTIPTNTFGIQGKTTTADNNTASKTKINGKNADITDAKATFLSTQDLDISSAEHPLSLSHKIFAGIGYRWVCHPYTPFLNLGIEWEFPIINNTALDQIGLWVQGGLTF